MVQDVGKSVIASFLFAKLKIITKLNIEYVNEYAKDCVYEDRLNILKNDQLYLFAKQNHKLTMLKNYEKSPDFVIVDSPLLLSNIYGTINDSISNTFKKLVTETFNSYNNINFFIERNTNVNYQESGRVQSEDEAKEIDEKIKQYLIKSKVKFEPLYNEDLNSILERVLHSEQFLNLKFKK